MAAGGWPARRPGSPWEASRSTARGSLDDGLGAFEIEAEADLGQAGADHGVAQPGLVLGVEHQEPATAGTDQLATNRAVLERELIPFVDARVRHAAGSLLLMGPVLVHQLAELDQLAAFQRLEAAQSEILDIIQVLDHAAVA